MGYLLHRQPLRYLHSNSYVAYGEASERTFDTLDEAEAAIDDAERGQMLGNLRLYKVHENGDHEHIRDVRVR